MPPVPPPGLNVPGFRWYRRPRRRHVSKHGDNYVETNRTISKNTHKTINPRSPTKPEKIVRLLKRKSGATILELQEATGWQAHSVRGAIAGTIKKKLGHSVKSEKSIERGRVYRIAPES